MKNYWLIIILLFSLVGCKTRQPVVVRETVIEKELQVVRDTTVVLSADSSMLRALIECDSLGRASIARFNTWRFGSRLSIPRLTIADNILTAECKVDSMAIAVNWIERYGLRSERVEVPVPVPVEVPVKGFFWWTGIVAWSLIALAALLFILSKTPLGKWIKTLFKII